MKLIDGTEYEIPMTGKIKEHFDKPENYAWVVIDEFNTNPMKEYVKPNSTILDIGANVGLFALYVMPYVETIVCIEPTPNHYEVLRDILELGYPETKAFYLANTALNKENEVVKFHNEPVNTTMNSIRNDGNIEIMGSTLKTLCNGQHYDLCKIDIEGGEWEALTEERIWEVYNIIDSFWVELHPRTLEKQKEMAQRFEKCGYKVELIEFNGTIFAHK